PAQCTRADLPEVRAERTARVRPAGLRGVVVLSRRVPGSFTPPPCLPKRPDRPPDVVRGHPFPAEHRPLRPGDAGGAPDRALGLDPAVLPGGRVRLALVRAEHRADGRDARRLLLLDASADAPALPVQALAPDAPPLHQSDAVGRLRLQP